LVINPTTARAQLFPGDVQLHLTSAFEAGLREKGYVLGREVVIEYRSCDGHFDQLPILAAELVRLRANVIVTGLPMHRPMALDGH